MPNVEASGKMKSPAAPPHPPPPPPSLAPACSLRFGLLLLTTSVAFSSFFSYDLPGITAVELSALWGGAADAGAPSASASASAAASAAARAAWEAPGAGARLGAAFALYALPNAVVPLAAGVAYARLGVWRSLIAIAATIACGVAVVAAGVWARDLRLFLAGRFLYGLVGESMLIGLDVLVSDWFRHAELGLAMGLVQGTAQAGSVAAFYFVPPLISAVAAAAGTTPAAAVLAPYALAVAFCVAAVAALLVVATLLPRVSRTQE